MFSLVAKGFRRALTGSCRGEPDSAAHAGDPDNDRASKDDLRSLNRAHSLSAADNWG